MTRVPSDDPGGLEPLRAAERLAGVVRRHVLAAAQASLRALREVLAQLPTTEGEAGRPAKIETPPLSPTSTEPSESRAAKADRKPPAAVPAPPPAELLRSQTPLPDSYGSDRLVLLARDPHCLYAYWDLSDAHRERVRVEAASDQLRTVLRIYDVTQVSFDAKPTTRFQDFAVAGDARSIYAYTGRPAACFVAEVGYLRADGAFFPLARSQPVWTPRTDQPGGAPGRWMTVGWNEQRDLGELVPVGTTDAALLEREHAEAKPVVAPASRQAPSSWPEVSPSAAQRSAAQRGSWSLVRGGLTTAVSPDAPPAARSEP